MLYVAAESLICPICGTATAKVRPHQRFCSTECRRAAERAVRGESGPASAWTPVLCPECGGEVPKRNGRQVYCSGTCQQRAKGRRKHASRRRRGVCVPSKAPNPPRSALCPVCGEAFTTYRPQQVNCSKRCYSIAKDRRLGSTHRGRARHFGVPYEQIDRFEVFEADGWRCQLCRRKVRRDAPLHHPLSPVLDHRVPLSVPGTPGHVRSNVQCAHWRCNAQKGDRIGGGVQLVLAV